MIYPMSAEAAELARDRDYVEYVPDEDEIDRLQDEALKNPELIARWIIECENKEKIVSMFRFFQRAERISANAGDMHDKMRRELVADMIQALLRDTREFAKEAA